MPYKYEDQKHKLYTPAGIDKLLDVKQRIEDLLDYSGACTINAAIPTGDSWLALAAIDYLKEKGHITIVERDRYPTQDYIILRG